MLLLWAQWIGAVIVAAFSTGLSRPDEQNEYAKGNEGDEPIQATAILVVKAPDSYGKARKQGPKEEE